MFYFTSLLSDLVYVSLNVWFFVKVFIVLVLLYGRKFAHHGGTTIFTKPDSFCQIANLHGNYRLVKLTVN